MTEEPYITAADLYRTIRGTGLVRRLLELARDEDLGSVPAGPGTHGGGDITSRVMIPAGATASAAVVARQSGVVSGLAAIPELIEVFGADVRLRPLVEDGRAVAAGATIATLAGSEHDLLAIERTLLNLVGRLSGIASATARFVAAVRGTRARIYDTRKTTPGLRVLEKYAVCCGGGSAHRMGLHDAVLIKDNHLAGVSPGELAGRVRRAAQDARRLRPDLLFVEVEVDTLEQLRAVLALESGVVDIVLLDNMGTDTLREAVRMRDASAASPRLEASGGVRLETVRAIAETGVERISAGALTHSVSVLDVALDVLPPGAPS